MMMLSRNKAKLVAFWLAVAYLALMVIISAIVTGAKEAHAADITLVSSAQVSNDGFTYQSQDYGLQIRTSGETYWLGEYRKMGVCPYYCGFDLSMYGIGAGKRFVEGPVTLFVQGGYYFMHASGYNPDNDENLYYYMANKFGAGGSRTPRFYGYDIQTKDTPFFAFGVDYKLSPHWSMQWSYQYLKPWINYRAFVTPSCTYPELWHDPANRDMSSYRVGISYNF